MKLLELTLAIIKPHVVKNPVFLQEIQNLILTSNFSIVESRRHTFSQNEANLFYKEHENKFFYNRLVTFMISGPCEFYILAREDAIKTWRELMGPTKVFKTQFEAPNTIRGLFGLSDTRNATHGSDSVHSARKEIHLFFPYFNIEKWYKEEEESFRCNQTHFNKNNFVHRCNK